MLRERGKFLKFETQTRRAESKVKKHQYTPVSNRSDNKTEPTFNIIEDNLKKRIRELEERTVRASKRGITLKVFDERRIGIYIQSLRELNDTKMLSNSLAQLLIEGFEDSRRRMITHEKNMTNMQQLIMKQVNDLETQLKEKETELQDFMKKYQNKVAFYEKEIESLKEQNSSKLIDLKIYYSVFIFLISWFSYNKRIARFKTKRN